MFCVTQMAEEKSGKQKELVCVSSICPRRQLNSKTDRVETMLRDDSSMAIAVERWNSDGETSSFFPVVNYTSGETKRARTAYTRHQVLGKISLSLFLLRPLSDLPLSLSLPSQ